MKRYAKCYFIGVMLFLFAGGVLWAVLPTKVFSEMENRYLNTWPKVSIRGIRSGEVQKQLTSAAEDQFVLRDKWMKGATALQKHLGLKDINGVYLGKQDSYFEKIMESDISDKHYSNNIRYVEKLAENMKGKVSVLLVPTGCCIVKEQLPEHAVVYNARQKYAEGKELLKSGKWINVLERFLKHENVRELYFRTDHHWTAMGAYEAYCAYMETKGQQAKPYDFFKLKCISDAFYGTLYSKAPTAVRPDELVTPQNIPACEVTCDDKSQDGIYVESKLKEKDKYGVYFGGNFGIVQIDNKEVKEGKTLVLIKDSYANSLVPYLLPHYKKIVMLDLRYFNNSVGAFMRNENPDEVLVLYEMSRFAKDSNLFKLMR